MFIMRTQCTAPVQIFYENRLSLKVSLDPNFFSTKSLNMDELEDHKIYPA